MTCASSASPPNRDLSNYVLVFFRSFTPEGKKTRLRDLLYDMEYAGAIANAPQIDSIPSMLSGGYWSERERA